MRALITGGAGFIGSNFIHYWFAHHPKDELFNLDKLTYAANLESLKDIETNPRYHFIKGDIGNFSLVSKLMARIDFVVHFAAETHVDRSIKDPTAFLKTNVLGTQNLLAAALKNKVKRFHHISTDEVFGELPLNSRRKFNEKTAYDPRNPYSASKAASDHLVRAFGETYGLPITISNCSNNYGPYQHPEKFIPRIITNLIDGKKIPIYGDGKYVRDWLYVKDHCRAIESILLKGKIGETYCVGGMVKNVNNLALAGKVLRIMNRGKNWIEFVKDRTSHDRRYAVDWSKINKELGWEPREKIATGLEKTIRWYQKNKSWWRKKKEDAEKFYQNLKAKNFKK